MATTTTSHQFLQSDSDRILWLAQNTDLVASDVNPLLVKQYRDEYNKRLLNDPDVLSAYCRESLDLLMLHKRIQWNDPTCSDARLMRITATNAAAIIDQDKYCTPEQLFKIKTKQVPPKPTNFIMQRGIDNESDGLKLFEHFSGIELLKTQIGFVLCLKKPDMYGCTPDGVGIWYPCLVELKCPWSRKIMHNVPEHYLPQVQFQMYVCNMPVCFFVQYKPPTTFDRGILDIVVVERDETWMEDYEPFFSAFHARVLAYITAPGAKEAAEYSRNKYLKEQERRKRKRDEKKQMEWQNAKEENSEFMFVDD